MDDATHWDPAWAEGRELSDRDKAIVLSYRSGLNLTRIATGLGITKQAVSYRLQKFSWYPLPTSPTTVQPQPFASHGVGGYEKGCRCRLCESAQIAVIKKANPPVVQFSTTKELRTILANGICPFCGKGPFSALGLHFNRSTCPSAREVKKWAQLPKNASISSPEHGAVMSEVSRKSDHASPPTRRGRVGGVAVDASVHTRPSEAVDGVHHGTRSGYRKGCRCQDCRSANSFTQYAQALKRASGDRLEVPHGLGGYTNYKCRCPTCSAAARDSNAAARARRNSAWRSSVD